MIGELDWFLKFFLKDGERFMVRDVLEPLKHGLANPGRLEDKTNDLISFGGRKGKDCAILRNIVIEVGKTVT